MSSQSWNIFLTPLKSLQDSSKHLQLNFPLQISFCNYKSEFPILKSEVEFKTE